MRLMQAGVMNSLPCIVSLLDTLYYSVMSHHYVQLCDKLCIIVIFLLFYCLNAMY